MHATIRHYRRCRSADLDLGGLTIVSGYNEQGKTSAIQAVAAALSGRTLLAGQRKTDAGELVASGAAKASVTLTGEAGETTVKWPSCKVETTGTPPAASIYATGQAHLLSHRPGERAQVLQRYLGALPTRDDLAAALPDMAPETIDRLWGKIEINDTDEASGWDVCHAEAKDKGAQIKGRWSQATGAGNYGEKKAAGWMPEAWEGDLADTSEEALTDALVREREYVEAAIASQAVGEDELRRLRETAELLDERRSTVEAARQAVSEAEAAVAAAQEKRDALPSAETEAGQPCPHCGKGVIVRRGVAKTELVAAGESPPEAEVEQRRLAVAEADGQLAHAKGEKAKAERNCAEVERLVKESEAAAARLAEQPAAAGDPAEIERSRERARRAEARLAAFRAKREADRLHKQVRENQQVIDVLAPDGLRARKLADAVERFCADHVAPFCAAAGWQTVTLEEGFEAHVGGWRYALLSESAQWRARVAIQVAMAKLDGSALVIVDGAEVLTRTHRNGLVKALVKTGVPALVAMTTEDRDRNPPPDLAARGRGRTYWMADGVAEPFGATAKEAA